MTDLINVGVIARAPGEIRIETLDPPGALPPEGLAVRMLFAPVNPADLLAVDGNYAFPFAPGEALGAEGVARVERVGALVGDVVPGDLVLPLTRGNWCRRRMLRRADIIRVPPGIDPRQAAMMRINPATARLLLDRSGARRGDAVIQNGATSSVAHWVRILARKRGIHIVDIGRRASDSIIAADSEHFAAEVAAASGGRPVRAALDCVAGAETGRLAACLDRDGLLLVYGHMSGEPCRVRSQILTGRGIMVGGFSLRPTEAHMERAARETMFSELFAVARDAGICLPVRAVVPLADIGEALRRARRPGPGRVLLDIASISDM